MTPIQAVLFGSPGVGKSYMIEHSFLPDLAVEPDSDRCVKAVFHPEYGYGDFMGKLLPLSRDGHVEYNYYAGHFLRALARAYSCILNDPSTPEQVALVIDELNRGNSSAIFGSVFQLLDRDDSGWSSYGITCSDMEFDTLLELIGVKVLTNNRSKTYNYRGREVKPDELLEPCQVRNKQIKLPPNLSILATINTSDTSIFYMDAAFKRRWDWLFIDADGSRYESEAVVFQSRTNWIAFVEKLNQFIRKNSSFVRNLDDKQIGHWFIKDEPVKMAAVQNKLLFFLWDSVFTRDKRPLAELLKLRTDQLVTFGDFCQRASGFVSAIQAL